MSQESQNQKSQKSKDSRLKESKTQRLKESKTKIMSQCDPKVSCPCPLLHCIALFGHYVIIYERDSDRTRLVKESRQTVTDRQ